MIQKTAEIAETEKQRPLPTGNERILVVDDEASIVRLEEALLKKLGYKVSSRTGSIDALEKFKMDPYAFDLVLTDMSMPNMTGEKLAREMIAIRPDIPVILCTGFSERIDEQKAEAAGVKAFLMK
ncbi:MAG: response regulator, partial [Desulfobacteraceae bacterium]